MCDENSSRTGVESMATSVARQLGEILLSDDLLWEWILQLDPHRPVYPTYFQESKSRLRDTVASTASDFSALWGAAKDLLAFASRNRVYAE
jgi:hypothetical protein